LAIVPAIVAGPITSKQDQSRRDELSRSSTISRHFCKGTGFVFCAGILFSSCAPEPTTPATTSLAGVWTSNAHELTLSQFRLTIVQEANGIVSGGWTAKGDGGEGGCAPLIPCNASGNIIGQNLVSQVIIDLLSAGKFQGALVEPTKLRGILIIGPANDTITFSRTGG